MKMLEEPVYEIDKDTQAYKERIDFIKNKDTIDALLKEVAKELNIPIEEIYYYHNGMFGLAAGTKWQKKYKEQLRREADPNNIYLFKKTSNVFRVHSPKFERIRQFKQQIDPFALHDMFGLNNFVGSQVVKDRLFVHVKSEMSLPEGKTGFKRVPYTEYLDFVSTTLKEGNQA